MMMWVGVGLFIAVLVVLFVLAEKFLPQKKQAGLEYVVRGPLLTKAEAAFYPVLVEAVKAGPEPCVVMCKVRLGDVIRPRTGLENSERTTHANKVDRKHLDFVVVRANDFGVVMGVELDDSSHQRTNMKRMGRVCGLRSTKPQKNVINMSVQNSPAHIPPDGTCCC